MFHSRIPSYVRFLLPKIICRLETQGKKAVFLTFDDGPIPETTPFILQTLKEYNVKATFFCVGENVKKHPQLFQAILKEGHIIGNHTFNHRNGWKTPFKTYMENVQQCRDAMHGVSTRLFRPPYGKLTFRQYNALKKKYQLVLWDVLTPDYSPDYSAEFCLNLVKKKTRAGSILVLHDNLKAKSKLPVLLPGVLDFLNNEKYEMLTVYPG